MRCNRRALAVLAGGFLLPVVVPPSVAAEGSPAGIEQSSFVSIGALINGSAFGVRSEILIPNAGHFAFMTSPTAFLAALTARVRPVAIKRGA